MDESKADGKAMTLSENDIRGIACNDRDDTIPPDAPTPSPSDTCVITNDPSATVGEPAEKEETVQSAASSKNEATLPQEQSPSFDVVSDQGGASPSPVQTAAAEPPIPVGIRPSDDPMVIEQRAPEQPAPQRSVAEPVTVEEPAVEPAKQQPLSNEAVTTHTAALWKYKPIPTDEPEPHEEYKCFCATYPRAEVIGASVRGKIHKHEGSNRDDWFECTDFEDWIIVAVSDGAGSKKYSRIGAQASCAAATSFIKKKLTEQKASYEKFTLSLAKPFDDLEFGAACGFLADLLRRSVLHAISKVEEAFEARKGDPAYLACLGRDMKVNDFAGTLLVSVIVPLTVNGKQENLILSCQIGDGIIAAIDGDAPFASASKLLGEPDSGSFSGETDFLTSPSMKDANNLMSRTRITRGTSKTILLMSDGVADDYFPNETEIKRLYLDLLANGILDGADIDRTVNRQSMSKIRKLPAAIPYPWVNDPDVTVAVQYVNKICDAIGCSLEEIWEEREILGYAVIDTQGFEEAGDKAERLKIWLDNYVERGSFDDRTLVIVQTGRKEGSV